MGVQKMSIWVVVSSSLFGIFLFALLMLCIWRRRHSSKERTELLEDQLAPSPLGSRQGKKTENEEFPLAAFSFTCIAAATCNFSQENFLGEGGFGPVYKGILDGQEVAVKRLSKRSEQGLEEFKNEILLIAKLQHKNLVQLLGCSIAGEEKILIYEYLPNRSLDLFLFDSRRAAKLDWAARFHIIKEVAQGVLYLHQCSRMRVIHRDLKASNILLDNDMNPKISDFGLAKMFSSDNSQPYSNRVVGTYGYMAPECAMEGNFSFKSDVFSLGVLLLEIISGRKNSSIPDSSRSLNLIGHAWDLWNEGRSMELLDPSLGDSFSGSEVLRCIHAALMCVQEHAADRPMTLDVVNMIYSESGAGLNPKRPAFYIGSPSKSSRPDSFNEMTISVVDGR